MVQLPTGTIDGSQRHLSEFVHLSTQDRSAKALFNRLSRIEIIAYVLIGCILFQNKISFDGVQLFLFNKQNTIQKSQSFGLFLQIYLLHQLDAFFTRLERLWIKHLNTIYL